MSFEFIYQTLLLGDVMSDDGPPARSGRKAPVKARSQRGKPTLDLLRALQSGTPAPPPPGALDAVPRASAAERGTEPADTIFVDTTPKESVRAEPVGSHEPVVKPEPSVSRDELVSPPVHPEVPARKPFGGLQADPQTRVLRLQDRRRRALGFWLVLVSVLLCVVFTLVVLRNASDLDIPLLQALRFQRD